MKLVRFVYREAPAWGLVEDEVVYLVRGSVYEERFDRGPAVGVVDQLDLLAPCDATKIIGAAQNYHRESLRRVNNLPPVPRFFFRPPTSLNGHLDPVVYPPDSEDVIHEAEIALVVKRRARNVPEERAADYILGYTCANDLTATDFLRVDGIPDRGKGLDTLCPLGPVLVTDLDPMATSITCRVNGEVRQRAPTTEMVFNPFEYLSFVSRMLTLLPGDVILTGSPRGMSQVHPGDVVEVEVPGIGVLRNPIVAGE